MIFGLTADDITNVFLALAALIVAVRGIYEKFRADSFFPSKNVENKVDTASDQIQELTNGTLKQAVKEAVREENRRL